MPLMFFVQGPTNLKIPGKVKSKEKIRKHIDHPYVLPQFIYRADHLILMLFTQRDSNMKVLVEAPYK